MSVETFAFASWTLPKAVINVHDGSGIQASRLCPGARRSMQLYLSLCPGSVANTSSSNVYHEPSSTESSLTTISLALFDIINSTSIISSTFKLVEPCAYSQGADQVAVEAFLRAGQPYPRDNGVQAEQRRRWWSLAWLENLGGASARCTELQPRLNLDSRIQAEDAGVGTILELEPDTSGGGGGALASGTELQPRLNLGSKLSVELHLQLDSKIAAEDAGVGTILELEPDISGGGGEALARSTEL
ncbi:hypothetical protein C8J57DRAFT_1249735 [Mycena rebaudengoi]|nr:hypothetical protein C8J57DRAFT_1249735 [Mycena rebaudengoi]